MKILHVYDYFAPGNSRFGFDLDLQLKSFGHEVHLLAGVGELGPHSEDVLDGIPCHTYPYGFGRSAFGMLRYTRRVNRQIFDRIQAREKFDLVLFNQPLSASGVLQSSQVVDVPKAYSFISPWAAEWEVTNPGVHGIRRWFQTGFRNRIEDAVLRACSSVMVVSDFMLNQLKTRHPGVSSDRLHVVGGAVDLDLFSPDGSREENRKKLGLPEKGNLLVTVRRLVPRMGVENLLRGFSSVLEHHPQTTLVIGGEGPVRADLEKIAEPFGDRVRFLGYVPDDDLPVLYRAGDLFVLPTVELEGFGLVLIEAMACGTPSMGTPVAAIPEVLEPEALFPGIKPEDLAAGINRFLSSPRPEGMREKVEKYAWPRVARKAEEVLMKALPDSD